MPSTPTLTLQAEMASLGSNATWDFDDNTGDLFIGFPYRWNVYIMTVDQPHNNHTTPRPYVFNARDVRVGDWFASGTGGYANQIVEITSASDSELICVLEDSERYNIFSDPNKSGNGLCTEGVGIIFRLSEDGLPEIGPLPAGTLSTTGLTDLQARFIARNLDEQVLVKQDIHGFFPGDVIYADFETDFGYKKVSVGNFDRAIGIVTEIGVPGLSYFKYRPLGKLVTNVNPPLWGQHGDVFYLDPNEPGALTNEKPVSKAVPIYLQLDLPTKAILLERGVDGQQTQENSGSDTNKYDVENVSSGQTTFILPADAKEVLYMAINGIENENYTFDPVSKVLEFDPVSTGYGVDVDDEVFFIYKS